MAGYRLTHLAEALRARPLARRFAKAFCNCGGTNEERRFAANLLRDDLSDREILRIYHALIFPNGVRKTSAPGRNTRDLRALIESGHLPLAPALRVLDIGSSLGLDALATAELLTARGHEVREFVLGDLYPRVLYDVDRELVFDEDGNLLQVRRRNSFVAVNFAYNHAIQRLTNAPKRLVPWLLKRRFTFDRTARTIPIPLVHPSIPLGKPSSPFRLRRMNVFEPLADRFDLVICMNLLLRRYFGPAIIERAVQNLAAHLEPRGSLVVGGADGLRVLRREERTGGERWCCTSWGLCDGCTRGRGAQGALEAPRRCAWPVSRAEARDAGGPAGRVSGPA